MWPWQMDDMVQKGTEFIITSDNEHELKCSGSYHLDYGVLNCISLSKVFDKNVVRDKSGCSQSE